MGGNHSIQHPIYILYTLHIQSILTLYISIHLLHLVPPSSQHTPTTGGRGVPRPLGGERGGGCIYIYIYIHIIRVSCWLMLLLLDYPSKTLRCGWNWASYLWISHCSKTKDIRNLPVTMVDNFVALTFPPEAQLIQARRDGIPNW